MCYISMGHVFSLKIWHYYCGLVLKMSVPWSLINPNIVTQETGYSPVPIQTPKVIHYSVMVKHKTIFLLKLKNVRYLCNRIYQPIFWDVCRFPPKWKLMYYKSKNSSKLGNLGGGGGCWSAEEGIAGLTPAHFQVTQHPHPRLLAPNDTGYNQVEQYTH